MDKDFSVNDAHTYKSGKTDYNRKVIFKSNIPEPEKQIANY